RRSGRWKVSSNPRLFRCVMMHDPRDRAKQELPGATAPQSELVPPAGIVLRTERLWLRAWTEADSELVAAFWGDPQITRFLGGPFPPEKAKAWLADELENSRAS